MMRNLRNAETHPCHGEAGLTKTLSQLNAHEESRSP